MRDRPMYAEEMRKKCASLWPGVDWKRRIAEVLGIDYATVCRYDRGAKIPGPVAISIDMLVELYKTDRNGKLVKRKVK